MEKIGPATRTSSLAFSVFGSTLCVSTYCGFEGYNSLNAPNKAAASNFEFPWSWVEKGFVRTNNGWIPKWAVERNCLILVISLGSQLQFCWDILPGNILFNNMFCLYGPISIQFHSWRPIWRVSAPHVNHSIAKYGNVNFHSDMFSIFTLIWGNPQINQLESTYQHWRLEFFNGKALVTNIKSSQ